MGSRRHLSVLIGCTLALAACGGQTVPDGAVPADPGATTPATTAVSSAPGTRTPSARAAATVAPVSARSRAVGLRDVRTIVPDAVIDLRYKTAHNFTGVRLYPSRARCLVHRSMAKGLAKAAAVLRRSGHVLVFWDCYRPHYVQVHMYKIVPNPNWVAKPGKYARSHEAGRSVDVTVARRSTAGPCPTTRTRGHCRQEMGTAFDNFTPRAYAFATKGVSARAEANRATLRKAMRAGGLRVYAGEWWHFDGPGAAVNRPFLRAPLY